MKKKLFFGIGLILASILAVVLAIIIFINLPDKVYADEYTVKQTLAMIGSIFLIIFGVTGLICGFAYIGTEL